MNDEWLLETLRYYGQLFFFERYQNLDDDKLLDTVRGLSLEIGSLYFLQQQHDEAVLMLDKQRFINIDFEMIGDSIGVIELATALRDLKNISQISRGFFSPRNITAFYISYENKKIYGWEDLIIYLNGINLREVHIKPYLRHKTILEFELERVKYSLVGNVNASTVVSQINHSIKNTGYEFVISPEGLLMFFNQEEKQKIKSERGLDSRSVGHHVLATTFTPNEYEFSQKYLWINRY